MVTVRAPDTIRVWRHSRYRRILMQALAAAVAGAFIAFAIWQVSASVEAHGLRTGFGFLGQRGGFQIAPALIPFNENSTFGRAFLVGLFNTLLVSALAIPAATLIGVCVGVLRLSTSWAASRAALVYVETIRNIPPLIQLFFWYFVALRTLPPPRQSWTLLGFVLNNRGLQVPVPAMADIHAFLAVGIGTGIAAAILTRSRRLVAAGLLLSGPVLGFVLAGAWGGWDVPGLRGFNYVGGVLLVPELVALTLALSVYQAAYVAETVRSGLESVPAGQVEAARALGLGSGMTRRLIVLPQALVAMLPPLATTYVNIVKASTLGAAIAYPDLVSVFAGTVLNLTGQAIEIMLVTGSVYLAISFGIAALVGWSESRLVWRRER